MLIFSYQSLTKAKIKFDEESRRDFDYLREQFKTENDATKYMKSYRFSMNPFIYVISPLGSYNVGMTQELCQKCDELKIDYEIEDELLKLVKPSLNIDNVLDVPNKEFQYRWYQKQLLTSLLENGRGVIISPTRSGKSLILAGLCHNIFQSYIQNKMQNILLLVPNINLVFQMAEDLEEYGLGEFYNIQMFTAKTMSKKGAKVIVNKFNIYIANSQYLLLHGDELPYIDVIIVDEVHGMTKQSSISKIIKDVKISNKFGCTGTLPKSLVNQWNISGVFGPVLDEVQIQSLQEEGILANVKVYPIKFFHHVKENFNYIDPKELEGLSKDEINEKKFDVAKEAYRKESIFLGVHEESNKRALKLCKNILESHENWNALILFDFTEQGKQLYNLLDYEKKHYVDGSVDVFDRKEIIKQMNAPEGGHITIAQSKTFSTGLTIKNIELICVMTNQSSPTKIIQSIGRGLRRVEKNTLVVLDFFHNYKYSEKHFFERVELYKTFYGLEYGKDYKVKEVMI